jgi:hypothetical protein
MKTTFGSKVFALKLDVDNASFFSLYSCDKQNFYLINGMDSLLYPRGHDEKQQALGRLLNVRTFPEQSAVELLMDDHCRGTDLSALTDKYYRGEQGEFFCPFFPPAHFLKPLKYWEERISTDAGVQSLDIGEDPKIRSVTFLLDQIKQHIQPRPVLFDPSCGTGSPVAAILDSGLLKQPHVFTSDLSKDIIRKAVDKIKYFVECERIGVSSINGAYGNAVTCDFKELDGTNPGLEWLKPGQVNIMLLRFLNQGVVGTHAEALEGFNNLIKYLSPGGIVFMFGYSPMFINSFDIDSNMFNIFEPSLKCSEGFMAGRNGTLNFERYNTPWIFPFYCLVKQWSVI